MSKNATQQDLSLQEEKKTTVWRKLQKAWNQYRANRNVKDVLFRYIFNDKATLLLLYNALNNSHYDNPEELQIITMNNSVFMSMKNDISFLIENVMNLYEHQSTLNLNMPLRGLVYFSRQYETYVHKIHANIYGKKRINLPAPRYIIFYNGLADAPERSELRLSDAYVTKLEQPAVEVIATMININYNHNMDLLNSCRPLHDYAYFIGKIREYEDMHLTFDEAVNLAVDYCIEHDILKEILLIHKGEVKKMLLTEYDPKEHLRMEHAEGIEEGISIGELKAKRDDVIEILEEYGIIPDSLKEQIMAEESPEQLSAWLKLAVRTRNIEAFMAKM